MDAREKRLARNEAVFREVNERSRELSETWDDNESTFQIVCECCDASCVEAIDVTPGEYGGVRSRPTRFLVVPGHQEPTVERLVVESPRFVVVEKTGEAADFVESFSAS